MDVVETVIDATSGHTNTELDALNPAAVAVTVAVAIDP
jgi:hypothetical protein